MSHSSGSWKSEMRVSMSTLTQGVGFSLGPQGGGTRWGLFYKNLHPTHESSTPMTYAPPKGPIAYLIPSEREVGETT